jgi:hypothetical protein
VIKFLDGTEVTATTSYRAPAKAFGVVVLRPDFTTDVRVFIATEEEELSEPLAIFENKTSARDYARRMSERNGGTTYAVVPVQVVYDLSKAA